MTYLAILWLHAMCLLGNTLAKLRKPKQDLSKTKAYFEKIGIAFEDKE